MFVRAPVLDRAISIKVLSAITPSQIDIAIKAFEELEQREQSLKKQWLMKIERATYEAQLAQRRYEEVDPSNRLVASTLEKDWNEALALLQEAHTQYDEYKKKNILETTKSQKESILALAKDFPRLWNAPSTSSKDRKRILRLLIKDITVKKLREENKIILHIRWQGGALETLEVHNPPPSNEWQHSDELINRVKDLALVMTDQQIAETLTKEGVITKKGNPLTHRTIQWIRAKNNIPITPCGPEEFSINQVAEKFNVSHYVVRYWFERKMINGRRVGSKIWLSLDPEKEAKLKNKVKNSIKIGIVHSRSQIMT